MATLPTNPRQAYTAHGPTLRGRLLTIFACLGYTAIWLFVYRHTYSEPDIKEVVAGVSRISFQSPPSQYLLLGIAMAVVPSLWLPTTLRYPSQVGYWLLYPVLVVPLMFVPYHVLELEPHTSVILPLVILGLYALLACFYYLPKFSLPRVAVDSNVLISSLVALELILSLTAIQQRGSLEFNLDLHAVYDRRFLARETTPDGSPAAYAISILAGSLAPFAIVIGLTHRRLPLILVGTFGLYCVFNYDGTKLNLYKPLIIIAFYALVRHRHLFGFRLLVSLSVLVLVAFILVNMGMGELFRFVVERQLVIPNVLTSFYWDFFNDNPFVYYSDSFLRPLLPRQYELPTGRLIAYHYFGYFETNANVGLWGYDYAQLGYAGMIATTILVGVIFRVLDSLEQEDNSRLLAMGSALFGLIWINTAVVTSLLSSGVLVSLLLLFLLRASTFPRRGRQSAVVLPTYVRRPSPPQSRAAIQVRGMNGPSVPDAE